MIIEISAVKFQSQHQSQHLTKRDESLRIWVDKPEEKLNKVRSNRVVSGYGPMQGTLDLRDAAQTSATTTQALDTIQHSVPDTLLWKSQAGILNCTLRTISRGNPSSDY